MMFSSGRSAMLLASDDSAECRDIVSSCLECMLVDIKKCHLNLFMSNSKGIHEHRTPTDNRHFSSSDDLVG